MTQFEVQSTGREGVAATVALAVAAGPLASTKAERRECVSSTHTLFTQSGT